MSETPFMPKATAVWLVENTTLTFKQIASFCNLHELEVKGIADGDVAKGIKAYNPILAGQLTREEIDTCSKDPLKFLKLNLHLNLQLHIYLFSKIFYKNPSKWSQVGTEKCISSICRDLEDFQ